jgi:hypothetical protein
MGASKDLYIHLTNIKPQDIIIGLRKKIKLLEEEIKKLKENDFNDRATNEDKPYNENL